MLFIYLALILFAPIRHRILCKRRLRGEIDNSIAGITACYLVYGFIFSGLAAGLMINSFGGNYCGSAGGGAMVLAFLPILFFIPVTAIRSSIKFNDQNY